MAPSHKKKTKADSKAIASESQTQQVQQRKHQEQIYQASQVAAAPNVVSKVVEPLAVSEKLVEDIPQAPQPMEQQEQIFQSPTPQSAVPKVVDSLLVDAVAIDTDKLAKNITISSEPSIKAVVAYSPIVTVKDAATQYITWSVAQVQDCYVFAKGRIDDVVITVSTKLAPLAETSVAKTLKPYAVKIQGVTVHIVGRVGDTSLHVVAQGQHALQKATTVYSSVRDTILRQANTLTAKLAQVYQTNSEKVCSYTGRVFGPAFAYVRNGCTFVCGRVGDMAISIKGKGEHMKNEMLQTYARTRVLAMDATKSVAARVGDIYDTVISTICSSLRRCQVAIKDGFLIIKGRVGSIAVYIRLKLSDAYGNIAQTLSATYATVKNGSELAVTTASDKANRIVIKANQAIIGAFSSAVDTTKLAKAKLATTIADDCFKVSSGSAVAGAVACGSSGGATGFVAGGAVGAAVGLVPAIFTFGLSIPLGAAIGSGTGLCVGTVAGGTFGFVGGGAAGYGAQKHKAKIGESLHQCKDYMKSKKTAIYVGATGGTA